MITRGRSARALPSATKNEVPLGPSKSRKCLFFKPPPINKERRAILKRTKQSLERQLKKSTSIEVAKVRKGNDEPERFYCNPLTRKAIAEYGEEFESNFHLNFEYRSTANCLQRHNINAYTRAKIIDWILEVLNTFECNHGTFFLAIDILDRFYALTRTSYDSHDMHLTGVVSILIASKYSELRPLCMDTVYKVIGHRRYSIERIKKEQECILRTLGFDICFHTTLDLVEYFIEKFANDHQIEEEDWAVLDDIRNECIYFGKQSKYEYELLKFGYFNHITNSPLIIVKALIYFTVVDISTKTKTGLNEKFLLWIQELIANDNNMKGIEMCTKIIDKLNTQFETRYPSFIGMKIHESRLLK